MKKAFFYVYGWIFIRPIRYCFRRMIAATGKCRWLPHKHEFFGWQYPNFIWRGLYLTVFRFCKWLYWEAWRVFCNWENGFRQSYPLIARIIHRIGATTAGFAISGGQCFHCGSEKGCQVSLAEEEGKHFELTKTWSEGTMDGTDHRFRGITTCPMCGFQSEYEDGSL